MKAMLLVFAVCIVGISVLFFIGKKPYHAMFVYYAGMFAQKFFMPNARVREKVVVQIFLMVACFLMAFIGYTAKKDKKISVSKIPCMEKGVLIAAFVVLVQLINGYFSNYAIFSMLVDVYKVIEIFIFYFLFTYIWRTTEELEKAIDLLSIEMCVFGVIEMFITERGGVGLNMIMSLAPIVFALGFYTRKKKFWFIIVCSLLIIIVSKTRTYLFGFVFAILLVFLFANGKRKVKITFASVVTLLIGYGVVSAYVKVTDSQVFRTIIQRFLELSEGFEEAGGYRIYEMEVAWSKFLESPIIGKGYGYLENLFIKKQGNVLWGDFMHNAYLEVLVKTGIFGFLTYGCGVVGYCLKQRKEMKRSKKYKNKETGFLVGGFAGTACWLFVYFAAPLSSFGYVFIPGMIGLLFSKLYKKELDSQSGFLDVKDNENGRKSSS